MISDRDIAEWWVIIIIAETQLPKQGTRDQEIIIDIHIN